MDRFEQFHDPEPPPVATDTLAAVQGRARGLQRRSRRRTWVAATAGVVLLAVAGAGVASRLPGGSSGSGDCARGVRFDGRSYFTESFNAAAFEPGELGDVVAVVKRTEVCPQRDGDASDLPVGAELRVARGVDPDVLVAAEVAGKVVVFRSAFPPKTVTVEDMFLLDDVVEVGINSEYDGETRWATLLDPASIAMVVTGITNAATVRADWSQSNGVFLEFIRSDGLRTRTRYLVDEGLLYDRGEGLQLPEAARRVISSALQEAPPAPVIDGLTVNGSAETGVVHPQAQCRQDRPDLTATPGETIQVAGPRRTSITFVFVSGPAIKPFSIDGDQLAAGIRLPDEAGRVTLEMFTEFESFCAVVAIIER